MAEMQELIRICVAQMEFLDAHESQVDAFITQEAGDMADSLRTAKEKCLVDQRKLLRQNLGELDPLLKSIVLNQNKLDHIWAPHTESAAEARRRHCPHLSRYEISKKVESGVDSFHQLVFEAHGCFGLFKETTKQVSEAMTQRGIHLVKDSGASIKQMERAFYKAFFVYKGDAPYRKLTDMLRASFVFDSFDELYRGFAVLEEIWEEHGGILRAKDRFAIENAPFGYRDLLLNVFSPTSQIVCEVQLHHTSMYNNKKGSHAIYKKARVFNSGTGNRAYEFAERFIRPVIGPHREPEPEPTDEEKDHAPDPIRVQDFREVLRKFNLSEYAEKFANDGWDDPTDWKDMEEDDLKAIGFKRGHLKKWVRVLQSLEDEMPRRPIVVPKPSAFPSPPSAGPVVNIDSSCPFTVSKHKMLLGERMEVAYDLTQSSIRNQLEIGSGWIGLVPSIMASRAEQQNDLIVFTTKFHMQSSAGKGTIALVDGPGQYLLKGFTSDDPRRGVQIGMSRKIIVEMSPELEARVNERFFETRTETDGNGTILTVTWDFSGVPDVWRPLTQGVNVGWIGLIPSGVKSRSEIINDLNHKQYFSINTLQGTSRIRLNVPPGFYEIRAFTADQGGTQIGAGIPISCGLEGLRLGGSKILSLNPSLWNEEEKTFVVPDSSGTIDIFWDLTTAVLESQLERDGWIGLMRPGLVSRNEVDHDSDSIYFQYFNTGQMSGHYSFAMREAGKYDIKLFSSDRGGIQLGETLSFAIKTSEESLREMDRQVLFLDGSGPFPKNSAMAIRFDFSQCSDNFKPVLGKGWIGFVRRGISSRTEAPNGVEGVYTAYAYITGYQGVWQLAPTFTGDFTLKAFTRDGGVQIGRGVDVTFV